MPGAMWLVFTSHIFLCKIMHNVAFYIGEIKKAVYIGPSESVIQRKGEKNDTHNKTYVPYWNFINYYFS